jgi:hypothetical protein
LEAADCHPDEDDQAPEQPGGPKIVARMPATVMPDPHICIIMLVSQWLCGTQARGHTRYRRPEATLRIKSVPEN